MLYCSFYPAWKSRLPHPSGGGTPSQPFGRSRYPTDAPGIGLPPVSARFCWLIAAVRCASSRQRPACKFPPLGPSNSPSRIRTESLHTLLAANRLWVRYRTKAGCSVFVMKECIGEPKSVSNRSSGGSVQKLDPDRFLRERLFPANHPPDPGGPDVTCGYSRIGGLMGQRSNVSLQPRRPRRRLEGSVGRRFSPLP